VSGKREWSVLVTGGAGYVGSALVPHLLAQGHRVTVLDLYLYGEEVLAPVRGHPHLTEVKGDLRDPAVVARALAGCNAVIHLACISNDPSFELNPDLGRSINYHCFRPLVRAAKAAGVGRFIYASSSSVYGIKEGEVTEDTGRAPLTDYSKYKALCEDVLAEERAPGFVTLTLRPATVCGYAPRQRLDVIVNILTNHAVNTGRIKVLGGEQLRPNLHILDMIDLYGRCLQWDDALIDGQVFNAGYQNHSVMQLGRMVQAIVSQANGTAVALDVVPTDDNRSYHVSSARIRQQLGFVPQHSIEQAVTGLVAAFQAGLLPDSMTASRYFNIKRMQELALS